MIWVFLFLGLVNADRLDRRYLPPPSRNFSGGSSDIIELPFEQTESEYNSNKVKPTEIAIGIDRTGPNDFFNEYENISTLINSPVSTTPPPMEDYSNKNFIDSNQPETDSYNSTNFFDSTVPYEYNDQDKNHIFDVSSNLNSNSSPLHFLNKSTVNGQEIPSSMPIFKNNLIYSTTRTTNRVQDEADRNAAVINNDKVITSDGYHFNYDTSNKIHADEHAVTINGVQAKGSYSYLGDDGKLYNVTYTADENGFRPQGNHLPTSPPIPDAILKVIEQAYKDKEAGIFDDGLYDDSKHGYRKYQNTAKDHVPISRQRNKEEKYILNKEANVPININNRAKGLTINESNENEKPNRYRGTYKYSTSKIIENHSPNTDITNNNFNVESVQPRENNNLDIEFNINNTAYDVNNANGPKDKEIMNPQTTSLYGMGYQYDSPQHLPKEFISRFSDFVNIESEITKQTYDTKATRRPFLTPYVSLNDGDTKYYNNNNPIEDSENDYDEKNIHGSNFDYMSDNNLNNRVEIPKETDIYDHYHKSNSDGYFYSPKASNKNNKETLITKNPSQFTHSFNNMEIDYPNVISGFQTESNKDIVPTYKSIENAPGNINITSVNTLQDDNGNTSLIKEPINISYSENTIEFTKTLAIPSTVVPRFGATFAPYIDIMDISNEDAANNISREEFIGPKQHQGFDASGYYY